MADSITRLAADFDALMARKGQRPTSTELRALTARIAPIMTAEASRHAATMNAAIADYQAVVNKLDAQICASNDRLNTAVREFMRG